MEIVFLFLDRCMYLYDYLSGGPKGLFGRMLHGYLYPSYTGHQVQKFNSPEGIELWKYLKELFKYSHPVR
ncbi:MAG TPA: hypothetical protein DDZ91_13635 [Firmicutes bacterium]|nr:hypothetical protein [Bacillota bacterium]